MYTIETQKNMLLWLENSFPTKVAIVDYPSGRRWTYKELSEHARRVSASYLKEASVEKGDRITWLSNSCSTDITALQFGAKKLGALPVLINARVGVQDLVWMINNVEAKSLAYSSELIETVRKVYAAGIPTVLQFIALGERAGLPNETTIDDIYELYRDAGEPDVEIFGTDDNFICYTSGTTNDPKPIVHKENGWAWTLLQAVYEFGFYSEDVWVVSTPPSFIGWSYNTGTCLRAGGKICCVRFDPYTYLKAISDEHGTHALLQPTIIRLMYPEYKKNKEEFDLTSMRWVVAAGEPVTEDIVAMLEDMFPNAQRLGGMGATEANCLHTGQYSSYFRENWDTLGMPLPGVNTELRDVETGEVILEPDVVGELFIKGPGVADRIWGDPKLSEECFPDGWWKTGDLFRKSQTGHYFILGRVDYTFKSGGIKVYPQAIEACLKKHPDILDAVVFSLPHKTFGFVPMACLRNRKPLTAEGMETWWLAQDYARYNRPREWAFFGVKPFPMTSLKLDRRKLMNDAQKKLAQVDNK